MTLLRGRRVWQALLILSAYLSFARGVFINFENCLEPSILYHQPLQLQWVPLFLDAKFGTTSPTRLELTLYGNVTGQQVVGNYPPPSDPSWKNPNSTFGKIANIGSGHNYTTLFSNFNDLSYSAWSAPASRFCAHVTQGECPLGPRFFANPDDPSELAAFTIEHDFGSKYHFSTLAGTITLISGDFAAQSLACVTSNITPDLGTTISTMLTWLPAAILIFKGIATLSAAIWSPWGSSDIFRWSSNYGRDQDLLRLVTPGFGDCLQYIQFVVLMGSLTLNYPGFFQPAVSQAAWSLLLFNTSYVTDGPAVQSLVDGVYHVNGTYGISAMRQLIGMSSVVDVWACMAIWLAVIAGIIIILCQLGFLSRWLHRQVTKTREQDLRQKNLPFTLGNMIRLLFNFFILPIIALSLYQLVISPRSPTSVIAVAAVLIAIWLISAAWILRIIFTTKPRTLLFDDMPTVLLYGPLYNTYSDSAAPFAFVPILITFMRGVAFGAVQPSGTAQLIILAVCEIALLVALNGFRPFMNQTSMNAYHTFFSAVRLITVLLSITFIPSLDVGESPKGWIGYTILLLHGCVLVFGFFLASLQTVVEVAARSLGLAGRDAQSGQARGSILNWRMLKKRQDRPATAQRESMASNAAMMRVSDAHRRSGSVSSQQLLNQVGGTPSTNRMSGFDNRSSGGEAAGDQNAAGFIYVPGPDGQGPMQGKPALKPDGDTFYRPPRKRTMTNDALNPIAENRNSVQSQDSAKQAMAGALARSGTDSPRPAFLRERADSGAAPSVRTDYAVREVDQYYRGPPLNEEPTRKLKTGPADPEGPAANAQSWFQGMWAGVFGRRKKEKEVGKGFEVVRSSRMPPEMQQEIARQQQEELEMQEKSKPEDDGPYHDSPRTSQRDSPTTAGPDRYSGFLEAERARSPPVENQTSSAQGFDFGFVGGGSVSSARQDSAVSRNTTARTRETTHPGMRAEQPSMRSTQYRPEQIGSMDAGLGWITRTSEEDGEEEEEEEVAAAAAAEELPRSGSQLSDQAPAIGPLDIGGGLNMPTFSRFASQQSRSGITLSRHSSDDRRPPQPPIPVRNPRRASNDVDTSRSPPRGRHDTMQSFGDFETNPQFLGVAGDHEEERASSVFTTSYHRAADSITRNSFGANAALNSASAEIVPGSVPDESGYLRRDSER